MSRSALLAGACIIVTACGGPSVSTDSADQAAAPEAAAPEADGDLLAFPGADGFGRYSRGGRGGTVYTVTNLNDSGPGSLREGVEAEGPRTIVFAVSGTIRLESPLRIQNDYITIAGQTAPGAGIALRDYPLQINANHVIVRYIRSRIGGESQVEDDAVSVIGGSDIILDHISASWAIDEVFSSSQSYRGTPGQKHLTNLTVQWSIIAEGLYDAGHEKGDRAYGSLIRGNSGARYSWHHNLWANHHSRMPRVGNYATPFEDSEGLLLDFRNNVFYNWGHGAETDFWNWVPESPDFDPSTQMGLNMPPLYGREGTDFHHAAGTDLDPASVARYNFVNNAYVQGPETLGPVIFYMRNTTAGPISRATRWTASCASNCPCCARRRTTSPGWTNPMTWCSARPRMRSTPSRTSWRAPAPRCGATPPTNASSPTSATAPAGSFPPRPRSAAGPTCPVNRRCPTRMATACPTRGKRPTGSTRPILRTGPRTPTATATPISRTG